MIAGQSLWDTFMFRPSPPAGPRSLKVTSVAFPVSNARRYGAILLVEAPEWAGAPRKGRVRQLRLLSLFVAYTFSFINGSWCP